MERFSCDPRGGLVASSTYRAFTGLGFKGPQANKLCKSLSVVAARCSFAIYLAHRDFIWRRPDLITPDDHSNIVVPVERRVTKKRVPDKQPGRNPTLLFFARMGERAFPLH